MPARITPTQLKVNNLPGPTVEIISNNSLENNDENNDPEYVPKMIGNNNNNNNNNNNGFSIIASQFNLNLNKKIDRGLIKNYINAEKAFFYRVGNSSKNNLTANMEAALRSIELYKLGPKLGNIQTKRYQNVLEKHGYNSEMSNNNYISSLLKPKKAKAAPKKHAPNKKAKAAPKKDCKPDQIRNPKSKKCVKRSGKIGKKIVQNEIGFSELSINNISILLNGGKPKKAKPASKKAKAAPKKPASKKAKAAPKKPLTNKDCKPDQIRNPATGKCVKRSGRIGRKLVGAKCKPSHILNPATGKCVKKSGRIGQMLSKPSTFSAGKTSVSFKKKAMTTTNMREKLKQIAKKKGIKIPLSKGGKHLKKANLENLLKKHK